MREQLVRNKYLTPFCRFVIVLASGSRIHVNEPGQLGRFDDEKVQFRGARGRWRWIAYRAHRPPELKDKPLSPAGQVLSRRPTRYNSQAFPGEGGGCLEANPTERR
jgi:hypothetical protein